MLFSVWSLIKKQYETSSPKSTYFQVWFSNRRARLRKHAGGSNPSAALGFSSHPLANMACQYPAETAQHDWRNSQFAANYNMFQQSSYASSAHQEVARSDYSALLDANYALAQAQMAHASNMGFGNAAARPRPPEKKDAGDAGSAATSMATSSAWNQVTTNHQQGVENLPAFGASDVFGQSQYAARNYWV